jgi:hypothetical protein
LKNLEHIHYICRDYLGDNWTSDMFIVSSGDYLVILTAYRQLFESHLLADQEPIKKQLLVSTARLVLEWTNDMRREGINHPDTRQLQSQLPNTDFEWKDFIEQKNNDLIEFQDPMKEKINEYIKKIGENVELIRYT